MSAQGPICRDCKVPMSLVEMQDEDVVLASGDIGMECWVEVWVSTLSVEATETAEIVVV